MSATNDLLDDEPTTKDLATLAAKAARAGWELRHIDVDGAPGHWRIARGSSAYVTRDLHSAKSILSRLRAPPKKEKALHPTKENRAFKTQQIGCDLTLSWMTAQPIGGAL